MSGRVYVMEGNRAEDHGGDREDDGVGNPSSAGLTDLLGRGPLFEVARRGYDHRAVDAYVEGVEEELRSLRRRLHTVVERYHGCAAALVEARRRPEERAEEILAEARAEAEARMANVVALREAATIARDEARRERAVAAAELASARHQADAVVREAAALRAEAEIVRADAEATAALRLASLQSEMEDLRRQRDEARAYLRRLTGQIEEALQSLTAVLPDDASALTDGPAPVAG